MSIYFKIVTGLFVISALLLGTVVSAHADTAADLAAADAIASDDSLMENFRVLRNRQRAGMSETSKVRSKANRAKTEATAAANLSASKADWTNEVFSVVESNDIL